MQIKTNNIPRRIIYPWELSTKERKQFDYINWEAFDSETLEVDNLFVRYKGRLYDLTELSAVTEGMQNAGGFSGWDAFVSESFFSGVVFRYLPDLEYAVVGSFYA